MLMNKNFTIISGPCSIDDDGTVAMNVAEKITRIIEKYPEINYIFKSSWIKANRTRDDSFEGIGFDAAMAVLTKVKETFNVRILTDIHESEEVKYLNDYIDVYQIPAYLCRQTKLIKMAASFKPVNIKKAQFASARDMEYALKKAQSVGQKEIYLCERGSCFGYDNLIVDFVNIPEMNKFHNNVLVDVTHSLQRKLPTGISGGTREYINHMARAATVFGAQGLFLECHSDIENAKSDQATQLELKNFEPLLDQVMELRELMKKYETQ